MSRWFRHYAGMMRDEKLVRVAVKAKQPVERVVWVWGAILESAAEINDGGRFEFDVGEAAYFLRCDEGELDGVLSALDFMGRISAGVVARWGDRQFDNDQSRDRQARYRERQKAARQRNGDVTPPSRDGEVTPQETETEEERADANASDTAAPVDVRQQLWSDGLSALVAITGKTEHSARSQIGKWLKDTRDDCAFVLSKIRQAQADRIGEPVSWITAAVRPPATAPPKARNAGVLALRQLNEMNGHVSNSEARHFLESDGRPDLAGSGIARRIAVAPGR